MYGYILAMAVGIVAIGFLLSALGGGSPPARGKNRSAHHFRDRPVQPDEPAADELTPDLSAIASTGEVEAANHHTPPA